jgi:hypothetical protein
MSREPKTFSVTTISVDVFKMVKYLEEAAVQVGDAKTPEEVADAYRMLCYARKFLYEYLEDELEVPEGTPVTHLRFL